jgi:hypothetical protein
LLTVLPVDPSAEALAAVRRFIAENSEELSMTFANRFVAITIPANRIVAVHPEFEKLVAHLREMGLVPHVDAVIEFIAAAASAA